MIPEESVSELVEHIAQSEVAMKILVEAAQPVLVERIQDRVADQIVDLPVSPCHGGNRGSCAGGGEVGPTGTRATTDRRAKHRCPSVSDLASGCQGSEFDAI